MSKKFFKQAQNTSNVNKAPEAIKPIEPTLELGKVDEPKEESGAIGVIENPAELPVTPEFQKLNTYKVVARGGLVLRESAPADTYSTNGDSAGAGILCIPYDNVFVEIKRENNWSYGNYNGKSGWVCNAFLIQD